MKKIIILAAAAAAALTLSSAVYAEKMPEGAFINQSVFGVTVAEAPDGLHYVVDPETEEILGGPYKYVDSLSAYAYAVKEDGTQVVYNKDASVMAEVSANDTIVEPHAGIYAIVPGYAPGEDYSSCSQFEIYSMENDEQLCVLDRPIDYYNESQTDKMAIKNDEGKYAFINKYGELQSGYVYTDIKRRFNAPQDPYPQSYAIVVKDGREIYIDQNLDEIDIDNYNGEPFITNFTYLSFYNYSSDSGLYIAESGDKQGLYSLNEKKYVIPLQPEHKFHCTNGEYVIIETDGKFGLADLENNVLVKPQYDNLNFSFADKSMLSFERTSGDKTRYGLISLDSFKEVFEYDYPADPSADGTLIYSYYGEDGNYRTSVVNYAGHKLVNDEKAVYYYSGDKFKASDYSMSDEVDVNIDMRFAVINLNGKYLDFDGVIRGDRTLVPMREVIEELGGTVDWDGQNQSVRAVIDGTTIDLKINSDIMTVNGSDNALDVPAQIINDKTMLPLRAVSEAVGADVDYDAKLRCVYITK